MDYFPLFADLRDQPCLVVGGGDVAARKARELAAAGARLTVVAPACSAAMQALIAAGTVTWRAGTADMAPVADHLLVVAATDDAAANRAIAATARAARRLCNVVDDAAASSFIVPGIVDRSPLIVAVSSGGHAPVLARWLRQRLERWLPAGCGDLARWAGSWRRRVRQRLTEPRRRRAFWEALLTGEPGRRLLAGDRAAADAAAGQLLEQAGELAGGKAWLVGAGPGDPLLISLRGLQALEQADVVLHDRLVSPALLRSARREAEIIAVGKTGGGPATSQAEIERLLVAHVRAGRRVCRLKGGDPFIFGRGGEEALALAAAGLPFEVVPGITAASGCGAAAGIPLTHRGLATAVTFVTAQDADGALPDWSALARANHTLAIYMGGRRVADIAAGLVAQGRAPDTAAAVIGAGTTAQQQVVTGTLADIAQHWSDGSPPAPAPALMLIGETVALTARLAQPLAVAARAAA